jgi:orotidine-5'-phosphate decarboxylase
VTGLLGEPFWSPVGSGGAVGRGIDAAAGLAAGEAAGLAAGEAAGEAAVLAAADGEADAAGDAAGDEATAGAVVGLAGAVVGAAAAGLVGAAGAADWQAARAGTSIASAARTDSALGVRGVIVLAAMIQAILRPLESLALHTSSFLERLNAAAQANNSWLCVGLDPDPNLVPPELKRGDAGEWVPRFVAGIVEATRDLVCCYKPNIAFFEALGLPGQVALRAVLKSIPDGIPVLVDAKRGDTPQTMRAYARAIFEDLGADAVTCNPYPGGDSLAPFFDYPDRGVFVLCKTSNPGAGEIQDLLVDGAEPLFLRVARRATSWDTHGTLGLVVGATYPADVAAGRQIVPRVPILLPGVGAQAGDLERSVRAAVDFDGAGALVNASRTVLYASAGADWQTAARAEADRLRTAINAARVPGATLSR